LKTNAPIPAPSKIHHGLFLSKSFKSSFKLFFSSAIGFTLSFVKKKQPQKKAVVITPNTEIVASQPDFEFRLPPK